MSHDFYRITISVTKDLKAKMDEAPGKINWSQVCRKAIEAELRKLEKAKAKSRSPPKK